MQCSWVGAEQCRNRTLAGRRVCSAHWHADKPVLPGWEMLETEFAAAYWRASDGAVVLGDADQAVVLLPGNPQPHPFTSAEEAMATADRIRQESEPRESEPLTAERVVRALRKHPLLWEEVRRLMQ